jgi:hypothetical protein
MLAKGAVINSLEASGTKYLALTPSIKILHKTFAFLETSNK